MRALPSLMLARSPSLLSWLARCVQNPHHNPLSRAKRDPFFSITSTLFSIHNILHPLYFLTATHSLPKTPGVPSQPISHQRPLCSNSSSCHTYRTRRVPDPTLCWRRFATEETSPGELSRCRARPTWRRTRRQSAVLARPLDRLRDSIDSRPAPSAPVAT